MASWGAELELHGISLELDIQHIDIKLKLPGNASLMHYQRDLSKVYIGPTRSEEFEGLKLLTTIIAVFLDTQRVPRNEYFLGQVDFKKAVTNLIDAQKADFFDLYKCNINLLDPPFSESINVYEQKIRGHFIFSADHSVEKEFVVPEIISSAFGLRSGGFSETQLSDADGIAFLQAHYQYAIALYTKALERNVSVYLPSLSLLEKIFNITPDSLKIISSGIMQVYPMGQHRFIYPQLNTIVDLTHFSIRPQSGISDPLKELLMLSKAEGVRNWISPHLIDYELIILDFTRNIIDNMNMRVEHARHVSDPWLRGAIGLGVWSVLSLCIGSSMPGRSDEKNLWMLMPKINVIDFLTGAFEASETLSSSANNYYFKLIVNFTAAFQEMFGLLPRDGEFARALRNSVVQQGQSLIQYRLQKWYTAPLPPTCPNLAPNDVRTILRLIMATLICGTPQITWEDSHTRIGIIKETFVSYADLFNTCKFMQECLIRSKRLSIKDRGGYGRPKFELRTVQPVVLQAGKEPNTPNYSHYINTLNAVARPAVPIPSIQLPPDTPKEYQHRVLPAASVDSRRSGSLYGGQIAQDERQESHSIWFPGIPGYEHGRRSAADIHKWLDEISKEGVKYEAKHTVEHKPK